VATIDISLASAERLLGALASATGRFDVAEGHFDAALRRHAAWGAEPWTAHTLHTYARMLLARGADGDAARAADQLDRARAIAERVGMTTLAAALPAGPVLASR
jgi:hypothetical protein